MTFMELEKIYIGTGRKSDARTLVACLLDAYDEGNSTIDIDTAIVLTGLKLTNISAVSKRLAGGDVLELWYRDTSTDSQELSTVSKPRWSKPYYKLSTNILTLFRRS